MSHGGGGGGFDGGSFHAGGHGGGHLGDHAGAAGHHGQPAHPAAPGPLANWGPGWLTGWLPGSAATQPRGAALALIIAAWVLGVLAVAAVIAGMFVH